MLPLSPKALVSLRPGTNPPRISNLLCQFISTENYLFFNGLKGAFCAANPHYYLMKREYSWKIEGLSGQMFDKMPERSSKHSRDHGNVLGGRRDIEGNVEPLTKSMLWHGGRPGLSATVSCFIRSISGMGADELKLGLHSILIKSGLESETSIATALIGFYASICDMQSAKLLFHQTTIKDLILWSAMVSACCRNRKFLEAIRTFSEMQHSQVSPNSVSLLSVLLACANTGELLCGMQIHGFATRQKFGSETSLQNALVDMYAKCGQLDKAFVIFYRTKEKDVTSWRNVIFGYTENRQARKAAELFSKMRASRVEPDEIIVRNMISVSSQMRDFMFGLGLNCYILKNGLSASISICTALLTMYVEFKELETAKALFDQLHNKDLIAWTAMISAYAHSRHPVLAVEMFKQMQLSKMEGNEITLVSLLQASSSAEGLNHGRSIHARLTRLGYAPNLYVASALIDFYCKLGRLKQGETLFDELQSRDLVCWSSMINGYGVNGHGEKAIGAFTDMLDSGTMPNEIVFVSLLSACSHCGLVDQGWKWFNAMEDKYGIAPTVAHCGCMVDMLGRQGMVDEAMEFITRMPVEPDVNVWGALLGWCKASDGDDTRVAEFAAGKLVELDPHNPSYYVTLSNMYLKSGRWEDAERIRQVIDDKWLKKSTGISFF